VVDEADLPDGLDHLAKSVMHHSVAEGRRADQPPFWLVDVEVGVGSRPIGKSLQFVLQLQQLMLQIKLESGHGHPVALASPRTAVGDVQVGKVQHLRIEVLVGLHLQPPLAPSPKRRVM